MADGYWNRQQPLLPSSNLLKRPRTEYEAPGLPSGHEMHNYVARDDERAGPRILKDSKSLGSAYDRYLQSAQLTSITSGEVNTLSGSGLPRAAAAAGMHVLPMVDPASSVRSGNGGPDLAPNGRSSNFSVQHPLDAVTRPGPETVPLPPDATPTLYVEGLPPDSTRREVAHIFRPFFGYKEVRLVSKDSKHRGGDPLILSFVDFENPACAATAMSALQGYIMDELNPDSNYLRLQFSRFPEAPGLPSGHEMHNYVARDDERAGPRILKDSKSLGSAYDRYLQSAQLTSITSGEVNTLSGSGLPRAAAAAGMHVLPMVDPASSVRSGNGGPDLAPNGRSSNFSVQHPLDAVTRPGPETVPLPPDATPTLYVEGLPPDSTRREVAHIFRPFFGYKEVRLVSKDSKHRGGDPLILSFVDFENPACAATAMSALQGYIMDELNPDSNYLRLQFSRFPGPRSGPGSRGKR